MSKEQPSRDDFEALLHGVRVAEPRPELRRRVLTACRQDAHATSAPTPTSALAMAWWSFRSWRLEQALCAAILVCLAVLVWLRGSEAAPAADREESMAGAAEVTETARRLARCLDQSESTAEYLTVQMTRIRRIRELESSGRVRENLRSWKGASPWS